jgi:hypothetical protein
MPAPEPRSTTRLARLCRQAVERAQWVPKAQGVQATGVEVVITGRILGHFPVLLANLIAEFLQVDHLQDLSHLIPPS